MWPFRRLKKSGRESGEKEAKMEENKMEDATKSENTEQTAAEQAEPAAETAAEAQAGGTPQPEAGEANPAAAEEPQAPAEPEKPAEPDWKDRYARAMADFDNFRKRTERDREDLAKFAAREVIKDLLGTAVNLALALD